jgi:hypothetical protein
MYVAKLSAIHLAGELTCKYQSLVTGELAPQSSDVSQIMAQQN